MSIPKQDHQATFYDASFLAQDLFDEKDRYDVFRRGERGQAFDLGVPSLLHWRNNTGGVEGQTFPYSFMGTVRRCCTSRVNAPKSIRLKKYLGHFLATNHNTIRVPNRIVLRVIL